MELQMEKQSLKMMVRLIELVEPKPSMLVRSSVKVSV